MHIHYMHIIVRCCLTLQVCMLHAMPCRWQASQRLAVCSQICQLAKAVGRPDLIAPILGEVRVAFGRLAPDALAALLAWLPLERAVTLLQADVRILYSSPCGRR